MNYTIIIPTLNVDAYIERCLDSILMQTELSIEVIVIDGGSEDSTLSILRQYLISTDLSLQLVNAPGSSIYSAMNLGISEATGEYILFLGADDILASNKILEQLNFYTKHNTDLIIGNAILGETPFHSKVNHQLNFRHTIHHQSVLYNSSIFDRYAIFDENFELLADFKLNRQCIFAGASYILIPQFISKCGCRGVSQRRITRMRYERLILISDWPLYIDFKIKNFWKYIKRLFI